MEAAATNPQLVTISDWSHLNSETVFQAERDSNLDLYCTNSILINGRGKVSCLPISTYMSLAAPSTLQALNGQNITAQGCSPPGITEIEGNFKFNLTALPPVLAYSEMRPTPPRPSSTLTALTAGSALTSSSAPPCRLRWSLSTTMTCGYTRPTATLCSHNASMVCSFIARSATQPLSD